MNEVDLVKIRGALEMETLTDACREMEKVLHEMGYYLAVPCRASTNMPKKKI